LRDAAVWLGELRDKIDERGCRLIWLKRRMLDKLNSYRRAGESYSEVILRIAEQGDAGRDERAG
jgi:hypothetical protein